MIDTDIRSPLSDANRDIPLRTAATLAGDAPCEGCGYNLRSLAVDARCPECQLPVAASIVAIDGPPRSRSERRWASLVFAGVVGMLLLYPMILWVELFMDFNRTAFGNGPKLNVIGPKVWAMALVQRSIGRGVESLGGEGTWLPLMNVTAVWLITARRGMAESLHAPTNVLRLFARWVPAVLLGGFLGFMHNVEGIYFTDVAISKYAMIGVAGVELPATALVFGYCAHVAGRLDQAGLRRRLVIAMLAIAATQSVAIYMAMIADGFARKQHELPVQLAAAAFQGACVVVGLFAAGSLAELAFALLGRAWPRGVASGTACGSSCRSS